MAEDASEDDIGTSQRYISVLQGYSFKEMSDPFARQIACADVILLNKTDIPTETQLTRVESLIQSCNSSAPVFRTVRGDIDLKCVIGINAYKGKSYEDLLRGLHMHDHDHDHDDGDHVHQHGTLHTTVTSIQVNTPVMSQEKAQKLDEWIRSVLWEGILPGESNSGGSKKLEILRCKGVYCLENGEVYVLQGVRGMYEITPIQTGAEDNTTGVTEVGKLVFIGKGLGENMRKSLLDFIQ